MARLTSNNWFAIWSRFWYGIVAFIFWSFFILFVFFLVFTNSIIVCGFLGSWGHNFCIITNFPTGTFTESKFIKVKKHMTIYLRACFPESCITGVSLTDLLEQDNFTFFSLPAGDGLIFDSFPFLHLLSIT